MICKQYTSWREVKYPLKIDECFFFDPITLICQVHEKECNWNGRGDIDNGMETTAECRPNGDSVRETTETDSVGHEEESLPRTD